MAKKPTPPATDATPETPPQEPQATEAAPPPGISRDPLSGAFGSGKT